MKAAKLRNKHEPWTRAPGTPMVPEMQTNHCVGTLTQSRTQDSAKKKNSSWWGAHDPCKQHKERNHKRDQHQVDRDTASLEYEEIRQLHRSYRVRKLRSSKGYSFTAEPTQTGGWPKGQHMSRRYSRGRSRELRKSQNSWGVSRTYWELRDEH